jgi:hypothetical protein
MREADPAPEARRRGLAASTTTALALFLVARVILTGLGIALWQTGLVPREPDAITRPYFGVPPVAEGWRGALLGVWQRFDAIHYQRIAEGGYSAEELTVFPPLYPWLEKAAAAILGGDSLAGGLLVSNIACFFALIVFYRSVEDEREPAGVARSAAAYLLFFPTAFFLLAPYSESLFLLLVLVCLREARRGRWPAAALAGLLAALTRLNGALLAFPLLVEALAQSGWSVRAARGRLVAAAAPVAGIAAFLLWRHAAGFAPLADVQLRHWNRVPAPPWEAILQTVARFARGEALAIEGLDLAVVVAMLGIGVSVARRMSRTHAVYFWVTLLYALPPVRIGQPLSSVARYNLALFPAFVVMAKWGQRPWINRAILYPSIALWLYLAGQYVLWGWVG